jgi:hypothetical protein
MKPVLLRLGLLLFALSLATGGCVNAEVRDSILALQKDHATYRKAVVPNPVYDPEETAAVLNLGADISKHLEKLEELTR